tara:strand:+ start:1278 stop:1676 length:399 start_codon:yes stop_codon:yes gene_type:complete
MSTKAIMITSTFFLGLTGAILTFIPNEISSYLDITENPISTISFQLLGALYLGFAMINWMTKDALIGGIYNKPLVVANLLHFTVGTLALGRLLSEIEIQSTIIISITTIYAILALLFGYMFRTNPFKTEVEK